MTNTTTKTKNPHYYPNNKTSGVFKYKNRIKGISINEHDVDMDLDKGILKLTNAFFMGLFLNIEKPSRVVNNTKRAKIVWYQDVLEWLQSGQLWFALYEEYLGYNAENLKKRIKNKVETKIKELKRTKTNELSKNRKI